MEWPCGLGHENGQQQPSLPKKKPVRLSKPYKSTDLPKSGQTNPGIWFSSLGSLHPNQHQQVGSCLTPHRKICCTIVSVSDMIINLRLEILQQMHTQARQVMMYMITWDLIDIAATTLLHPATLQYKRKVCVVPVTLLQDRCLQARLLSIGNTSLEPAAGVCPQSASIEGLQGRAARMLLP